MHNCAADISTVVGVRIPNPPPAGIVEIGFNICLNYLGEVTVLKWVTREFVHVDRTACPWLIKKFVDPQAEFIFVSTGKIGEVVKDQGATPFDAPGVKLGTRMANAVLKQ